MCGSDPRLWDWATRWVAHCWVRIPNRSTGVSPFETAFGYPPATNYFRKFGCLCYARREPYSELVKMEDRYERGVFLGANVRSGAFLVGVWRKDNFEKYASG